MSNWSFPGNQGGQRKGIADAGIESFSGDEIASLAREVCQNSLDAVLNEQEPVIVEFYRHKVNRNQIPGIEEYEAILNKCKEFWSVSGSKKTMDFLGIALKALRHSKSYVLRVSDYNTKGLESPYSDTSFGGWNSLVKIDGGANKNGDKAGAFGIGKNAPFANSFYRLVFYRTLNEADETASQGVSRLISFKDDTQDDDVITTGIGYFGNPKGNQPVQKIDELEELNKRDKIGTDVFIYGFKNSHRFSSILHGNDELGLYDFDKFWEDEIAIALIKNFFVSIYKGNISLKVQGLEINKNNLDSIMSMMKTRYLGKIKSTYGKYLCLTREETKVFTKNFHDMGELELKILVDPNEKLDRKILIVRKTGMKLFDLDTSYKANSFSFTGVLELKGEKINEFFREMETVAHDKWEPKRHSDPEKAKEYYKELKEWIGECVAELAKKEYTDEVDVKGLGGMLQRLEDGDNETKEATDTLDDILGKVEVIKRTTRIENRGFFHGEGDEGMKRQEKVKGRISNEGDSTIRTLKGNTKRSKTEEHVGVQDNEGQDIATKKKKGGESICPLENVRIIKKSKEKYSISFKIPYDVETAIIEIVAVGENGKFNPIKIAEIEEMHGGEAFIDADGKICAISLSSTDKIKLDLRISVIRDFAMEINVYERD